MNKLSDFERELKRFLKRRISINAETTVKYLICGIAGLFMSVSTLEAATYTPVYGTIADGTPGVIIVNQMAIGKGSSTTHSNSVAIGDDAKALYSADGTSPGSNSTAVGASATTKGQQATAIGNSAEAIKFSTALGQNAKATGEAAIAVGQNAQTTKNWAVAIGVNSVASEIYANALGAYAKAANWGSSAIGHATSVTGDEGTALGYKANVTGRDGTALGSQAQAVEKATATGARAVASGINSVATGFTAKATGTNSVAIGLNSQATAESSVALGRNTTSTKAGSTAVGNEADATGEFSTAMGHESSASGSNSLALGTKANAIGNTSIAIGKDTTVDANDSIALGLNSKVLNKSNTTSAAIAIGKNAQSNSLYSTAIGYNTNAIDQGALAMGEESNANGNSATAIGSHAEAKGSSSLAFGNRAVANANKNGATTSINHGTLGEDGKETFNGDSSAVPALAIGADAKATNRNTIAIGTHSNASGNRSLSIGSGASSTNDYGVAIGYLAQATGISSIAVGTGNVVKANNAGAFGDPNIIKENATGSYAFGNDNVITTANTFVLGNNINNSGNVDGQPVAIGETVENSVYLGNNTTVKGGDGSTAKTLKNIKSNGTDGETTTAGSTGTVSETAIVIANTEDKEKLTYSNFAGAKANGVVSVGAAGTERRIQNVAAGEISSTSTDAINGSQLYAVADKLGNEVGSIYFHTNDGTTTQEAGNSTTNKGKITDKAGATGTYAISAGVNTTATNAQAIAIGRNVTATGKSSIAIGNGDNQYETDNVALRKIDYDPIKKEMVVKDSATTIKASTATGEMALAIGGRTVSSGLASTAVGPYSHSSGQQATAIGAFAAASGVTSTAIGTFASAKDVSTTAIGEGSKAEKKEATALGSSAIAAEVQTIAIGSKAQATSESSIAVGKDSKSSGGQGVAIGRKTNASGHSSIAIGTGDPKEVPGAGTNFVDGVWDDVTKEVKFDNTATRPTETEASGFMSTAIGQRAVSKGISSIAIGTSAYAVEKEAVAIGVLSAASGGAAVAIGSNAASKAEDTVAVGFGAKANKNYGVAIGSGAVAGGNIQDKDSKGIDTIAIGKGAKALADKAISIGTGNIVSGDNSGAFGDPSYISGTGTYTIGNNNGTATEQIAADNSGIFGNDNKMSAAAGNSRVIGNSNTVTHEKSFILGNNITTVAANSVYLGDSSAIATAGTGGATGTVTNGTVGNITYGNFAGATSVGAVTVGSAGNERRIQNVAAGKISADSTDVINGSQLYVVADKLGNEVESIYFHTNDGTTTQEAGNSTTNKGKITDKAGATGTYAISAGVNTTATNAQAIAIGRNVTATGKSSIAIGNGDNQYETDNVALRKIDYDPIKKEMVVKDSATTIKASTATGEMALAIGGRTVSSGLASTAVGPYSHSSGQQATAIGAFAAASGETSTAIGTFASAKDVSTTAIGEGSKAEKKEATALGSSAIAAEIQATAIGYGAKASHDNSIALGSNSITKAGVDRTTNPVTINSIQYSGFVGNGEKNGVVSVGDTGKERQIVNVAAGEISKTSTDAINGSQLYMTNNVIGNIASSMDTVLGGNADYTKTGDNAGTFTMTNIGDTNQNTIHDAIKAAKTKVVAGKNISSVNETPEADGSKKYTIDAYKTTVEKADGDTLVTITGDGTADGNNIINYKVGVTKGSFDTTTDGKINAGISNGIATTQDVANVVNTGYWTAKVNTNTEVAKVKFGDSVNFVNGNATTAEVKDGGITYNVNVDDDTIKVENGKLVATAKVPETTNLTVADGKVTSPSPADENKVVNAKNIADTINKVSWTVNSTNDGGENGYTAGENSVKAGETLNINSGKNIKITGSGKTLNVATKDDVTFTNVSTTNLIATGNTTVKNFNVENGSTVNMGGNTITNIGTPSANTDATTKQYVDSGRTTVTSSDSSIKVEDKNGDANIYNYDIKVDYDKVAENTNLNYKANDGAAKTVTLNKGLNFKNGEKTVASVEDDGVVTFDLSDDAKKQLAKEESVEAATNSLITVKQDGTNATGGNKYVVDVTKGSLTNADGKVNAGTSNGIATTQDVANAVNAGYWTAKSNGTTKNVKFGDTVEFVDGNVTTAKMTTDGKVSYDVKVDGTTIKVEDNKLKVDTTTLPKTVVAEGTNTKLVTNTVDNVTTYTVNAYDTKVSAKNDKVTVTGGDLDANNIRTYTVGLSEATENVINNAVTNVENTSTVNMTKTGNTIKADVITGTSSVGTDGKATTTDTAKVATVGDIVNTINSTYWTVNSNNDGGENEYTTGENSVKAGETLNINSGKNIKITGSGKTLNIATKDNVTFNNVTTNNLTATGNTTVKNFTVSPSSTIHMGNNVITNVASGGDIDTNVANIGDVKNIAAKSVEKVVLDESITDNIATINTASKKPAGEAGETYKVGVSKKAVQDAAKEIIDVVGTDPISVTPTTNDTTGKKTFTVTYNGENAATSTPLTYKANGGNNQTVMLSKGLDFTNGNYTTASIADNGVVKYDVTIGEITQGTDGKPGTNGKDGLVTTETLIKTLGNTGWNANAAANGGTLDGNATKTLVKPGDEVIFAAGKNLTVKQTIENGKQTYTYSLNKEISDISKVTVGEKGADGQNGVDGAIGVNGKDGSSVVINGKDGSIGLNGKDGSNGLTVKGDKGADGVDGANGTNGKTRIVYEYKDPNDPNNTIKEEVATLNDGMKYAGDDAQGADKAKVITKKLNETVDIMGGADKNKLTENNIGVNNVDGKLKVQLAKEINLGTDGSLTTGKTKVDTNGITITKADGAIAGDVKLTNTGLDNGGNKIVNVAKGEKDTDAVNVSQLKEYSNAITNTGLNFAANSGNNIHKNLGETLTIKGTGTKADELYSSENIKTKTNNDGSLEIMLDKDLKSNSITVGEKGEPGKDGVDGKIVVADGSGKETVVINGKDGSIGLTGPKGADGKDASATISVKDGTKGLDGNNGKDGESKTRIVYKKPDGNTEEVATLNDGLKFKGDTDTVISKKLNQTLEIIGGADKDKLTDKNIGVIEKDGKLEVKLAKNINLGNDGTITAGNTVINNSGITINNNADGAKTVSLTNNGLNNGGNKITNVAPGEVSSTSKDAINGSQLYSVKTEAAKHTTVSVDGGNKGLADGKANANLILTETTNDAGGKHFDIKLSDKVTLGNATDKQITVDGETGTISVGDKTTISNGNAKFDKVKVNGTEGTITGLTNKEWKVGETQPISGRAATEDQLKHVEDGLTNKITDIKNSTVNELTEKGLNFAGNSGEVHKNLGDKFTIKGSGTKADDQYSSENIKTKIDKDGNLEIMLDKDLKANNITVGEKGVDGKDGIDGTIGVNGKDGSSVVINGKDGSIGLTGPKGADGKDGASANISVKDGSKGLDGNNGKDGESKTRIVYETKNPDGTKSTEEVATLNDGLNFMGDTGDKAAVKLNKQVNIVGGQADSSKLSDGANIGVVSSQNGENGKLEIKLAKDLAGISSITLVGGKDKDGNDQKVTINVSKDGALDIGGKKLTGIADGEVSETSRDAVNGSQLHQVKQDIGDVINNHAAAINNNSKRIDKLDGRINSGLANSAAMSTLEFQEMGINQAVVGAAIGTYRGNQAVAVGIQGAPTENIRVQAKVSVAPGSSGGADAMAGIGASWKFNLK